MTPKSNAAAKRRLAGQFPAADIRSLAEALPERKSTGERIKDAGTQHEYYTRTAKGTEKVLPPPKEQLRRTLSEGRAPQVMPHRAKTVKLTAQMWSVAKLINFFLAQEIVPISTLPGKSMQGWSIFLDKPNRAITSNDQLQLMLSDPGTKFVVRINAQHKHLVIDDLNGE